jgi:predicted alpha/beta superfamily hydrolase
MKFAVKLAACGVILALGAGAAMRLIGQWRPAHGGPAPVTLSGTRFFDLRSTANGKRYRIFVATPEEAPPARGYPVLYVLDGNTLFATAVQAARARAGGNALLIVGVGYPADPDYDEGRRYEDFTPPTLASKVKYWLHVPQRRAIGGNERFYRFLEDQVKPEVAHIAPVDPERATLFGHSLGGLFTLHVLFRHPNAFTSYVAASPSIWWQDRALLDEEKAYYGTPAPRPPRRVLIEAGGNERMRRDDTGNAMQRAVFDPRVVDNASEMAQRLAADHGGRTHAGLHIFPGQTHMSYFPQSLDSAVRFALADEGVERSAQHAASDDAEVSQTTQR